MPRLSLFLLLCAASAWAGPIADQRAEDLALSLPRVQRQLAALKDEAGKIGDMNRRDEALSLLDRPRLRVLERRRFDEWALLARLKSERLLAPDVTSLLPKDPPMAFVAAPGSVWGGHHSYPGGLLDHELFNTRAAVALAGVYRSTYGLRLDTDMLRSVEIMHDVAKTATLHWKGDGSLPRSEPAVAGTPLHHILAISEAILRGWPPSWVVALASCHSPPRPGPNLKALIGYLKAGAIVAGAPYEKAGLNSTGLKLAIKPPIEAFVAHLADHDYVLTESSIKAVERTLPLRMMAGGSADYWDRDRKLAQEGDLPLYQKLPAAPASFGAL